MNIELNKITDKGIIINENITYEDYNRSLIKDLSNISVKGKLFYNNLDELIFMGNISGVMKLVDANSGDIIDYPFDSEIDDIIPNDYINEKSLDLKAFLWQNIVLEVPIRVSNSNIENLKGDGWELRDENSKKDDPRLDVFKALLDKGKE